MTPARAAALALGLAAGLRAEAWSKAAGSTALTFLRLDTGARQVGMGGVGVGLGDDVYSSAYNPAWLTQLGSQEAGFSHAAWLQDINYQDFLYGVPARFGTLGLRFQHLGYGEIAGYDATGAKTGSVGARDLLVGLAYARSLPRQRLSLGLGIKLAQEELAGAKASSFMADLGLGWSPFKRGALEGLSLGAAVKHLGSAVRFDRASEPLPTSIEAGLGYRAFSDALAVGLDVRLPKQQDPRLNLGGEFWLRPELALRMGFESGQDQGPGIRAGVGFRVGPVQVDYAFFPLGDLGLTHHIGGVLRFGGPGAKAYREGLALMRENRPGEAILKFHETLRLQPRHPSAALWLRRAHKRIKQEVLEEP